MPLRVVRYDPEGDSFRSQIRNQLVRAVVGFRHAGSFKFMFFKDIRNFMRTFGRECGEVIQNGYVLIDQSHLFFHRGPIKGGFRDCAVKIKQHTLHGSFHTCFLTTLLKFHRNQIVEAERFSRHS